VSHVSPIYSALAGIRAHLLHFEEAAARLSRTAPDGDLPGDLVALKVAKYGVEANVKALQAADGLVGSLLDVLA
jgi:hypothetical protein